MKRRETCVICTDVLSNQLPGHAMEPVALKCTANLAHVFHRSCISEWLKGKAKINKLCPICRVDPTAERKFKRARAKTLRTMALRKASPIQSAISDAYSRITSIGENTMRRIRIALAVATLLIVFIAIVFMSLKTGVRPDVPVVNRCPVIDSDYLID